MKEALSHDVGGAPRNKASIPDLALLFLRLGIVAFGGPAAHIAMMQEETVRRRGWLTKEEFVDLLGAANLIPGPTSTELALHIGYNEAGWTGLWISGICFIAPSALLVSILAAFYEKVGQLPSAVAVLYGVKPVVMAVILQALWNIGKTAAKTRFLASVGAATLLMNAIGINIFAVLFGTGLLTGIVRWWSLRPRDVRTVALLGLSSAGFIVIPNLIGNSLQGTLRLTLFSLFFFFLKVGAVVFGSGYVLIAFLRTDLVQHWHWLSTSQLLDAIAVGQITPGPLFTSATFIGYVLLGPLGAFVATVGIFLPGFLLVGFTNPIVSRLRKDPVASSFLDGVNVAALSLMAVVSWQLGRTALVDGLTALIAAASIVFLVRFRVNSAWLVLAGAVVGTVHGRLV